jgi:hypothetical protein
LRGIQYGIDIRLRFLIRNRFHSLIHFKALVRV